MWYELSVSSFSHDFSLSSRGIALACLGGPIYAIGGLDDSTCYNIVERYDPESDSWSFVQPMLQPRGGVAVAPLKVLNIVSVQLTNTNSNVR